MVATKSATVFDSARYSEASEVYTKMALPEFTIPLNPEDLAHEDCEYHVRATDVRDLNELDDNQLKTFTQGMRGGFMSYLSTRLWKTDLTYNS